MDAVNCKSPVTCPHEEVVRFDDQGKVVVKKGAAAPNKLIARRAIEAHLERKQFEKEVVDYWKEL